jgi:capsular polysaccharide export protein
MKKILIFVPSLKRAKFFYRLYENVFNKNSMYKVVFLTTKKLAFNFLKNNNIEVYDINKFYNKSYKIDNFFIVNQEKALLMDLKINLQSRKQLLKNYYFLITCLVNFIKKNKYDYMFIFNGNAHYIEYSAKLVSEFFKLKTIFFEIGNFPNKIFIDTLGVNATSSLMYKDLRNFECNIEKFKLFAKDYLINKEKNHFVPQGIQKINFYDKFINHDRYEPNIIIRIKNLFKILIKKIKYRRFTYDNNISIESSYIFFPLQVSYDSQLLRNSNVTLKEAIDYAVSLSKKKNKQLIIKPHPAELNFDLLNYAKKNNALIKNADIVITINSTVGLETFFYNKKLIVLGDAWYKKYINSSYRIKLKVLCNYFNSVLVDGDYFNKNIVINSDKIIKKLNAL